MKTILIFVFIVCTIPPLSAKPKVLATASMWANMAKVIGGDLIELDLIVPIGSDPHLYEPTPGDIRKVQWAQLILINGLTFEGWLQKLINSSGTTAIQKILTEDIIPISSPQFKNATDPHAWMDPLNGKIYATNLFNALAAIDPGNTEEYLLRLNHYLQELDELHAYIQQQINRIPEQQRVLITSHDAFHYFGNRYGLQVESLLGTSTDADVQTGDFIRINQLIKNQKIPAIFIESTINPKLMEQLSKENKIQIGGKLFADSLDDPSNPAGTYTGMLKSNTDVITSALMHTSTPAKNPEFPPSKSYKYYYLMFGILILGIIYYFMKRLSS